MRGMNQDAWRAVWCEIVLEIFGLTRSGDSPGIVLISGVGARCEFQQQVDPAVEHLPVAGVADAEVRVAVGEDRPGDNQQAAPHGAFDELRGRDAELLRDRGEGVERAARGSDVIGAGLSRASRWSRFFRYAATWADMSVSARGDAATCTIDGAQTNEYCCSLVI